MKSILACLTLLLLVGCSSRGVYEGTQVNRVQACDRHLRIEAYQECVEKAQMRFDEYEALRKGDQRRDFSRPAVE